MQFGKNKGFTPTLIGDQASQKGINRLKRMSLLSRFTEMKKRGNKHNPQLVSGFTLIELLIVISMTAILATIVFSSYSGFRKGRILEAEVSRITTVIRETMERSRSQADGEQWGIHFANPAGEGNDFYEIWKGNSYSGGTVTDKFLLDASLQFTDPASASNKDAIFSKATGLPTSSLTVVFGSTSGGNNATISADVSGRINYTTN